MVCFIFQIKTFLSSVSSVVLNGPYTPQIAVHVIAPHLRLTETFWEPRQVRREPIHKAWEKKKNLPFLGIAQAIIAKFESKGNALPTDSPSLYPTSN